MRPDSAPGKAISRTPLAKHKRNTAGQTAQTERFKTEVTVCLQKTNPQEKELPAHSHTQNGLFSPPIPSKTHRFALWPRHGASRRHLRAAPPVEHRPLLPVYSNFTNQGLSEPLQIIPDSRTHFASCCYNQNTE